MFVELYIFLWGGVIMWCEVGWVGRIIYWDKIIFFFSRVSKEVFRGWVDICYGK